MQQLSMPKPDYRSAQIRKQIVDILSCSRRGHLGSALSIVEIIRVLYDDILQYDPKNPVWPQRDRFILSKGHGCLALYVLLADKGFYPQQELYKFCTAEGILGGHPEFPKVPGVETSTGALGHGFSVGIGMALNARCDNLNYRTFVLIGDGECNEGSIWEAAMCAGKHRLSSLLVMVDYNKLQSYGAVADVQVLEPFADKWRSFGFHVEEVDGHDVAALKAKLEQFPFHSQKPGVLICHTTKGKGIDFAENNLSWHHKSHISDEDIAMLYKGVGVAS